MKTTEETPRPVEILLVEDNPADARLTREALAEAEVCNNLNVVGDGVEGLAYLRGEGEYRQKARPDLILLDLNLPRKDGREMLAELKADPRLKRIPVIVLTTSTADEDVSNAYKHNVNCYVTKPVDFDQFVGVVKSIENFWLGVVKLPLD
jgi:two-component system, chemotaxis family, response regulator Rcp1